MKFLYLEESNCLVISFLLPFQVNEICSCLHLHLIVGLPDLAPHHPPALLDDEDDLPMPPPLALAPQPNLLPPPRPESDEEDDWDDDDDGESSSSVPASVGISSLPFSSPLLSFLRHAYLILK